MTYCPPETPVWLAGHPQPAACVGGRHSPPCEGTPWAEEERSYKEQSQFLGHNSIKIKKIKMKLTFVNKNLISVSSLYSLKK